MMKLLSYRSLVLNLVLRNIKVKYQRSFLGFFWTLVNPLIVVGVLTECSDTASGETTAARTTSETMGRIAVMNTPH